MSKEPTAQDLVRLKNYEHYYINPKNGRIFYRKTEKGVTTKIATGVVGVLNEKTGAVSGIQAAKDVVALELEARRAGKTQAQVKREKKGGTNPTIAHLWTDCLAAREDREESTRTTYDVSWRIALQPFWGELTLLEITQPNKQTKRREIRPDVLEQFKAWYLKTHPKRQFLHKHLVMLMNFLFIRGYIEMKPDLTVIKGINAVIRKKNRVEEPGRVATPEEQAALIAAPAKMLKLRMTGISEQSKKALVVRTRLLILFGLRCGMRKMEAGKLKWEQYDQAEQVMNVWSFKNHEWRKVPLVPELIEALREQRAYAGNSVWIFPMLTNPAKHCSSQVLDHGWIRAKKVAGISKRLRFHDLRHTFATRTADENWPPILACELLDMSLDVYQNTYCKGSLEKKRDLIRQTFAVINQSGGKA